MRIRSSVILVLAGTCSAVLAEIEIVGLEDSLLENALAHLSLDEEASTSPPD